MKAYKVIAVGLAFVTASLAHAITLEEAYIKSFQGKVGTPVPVEVVSPSVPSEFIGSKVTLEFTVTEKGAVENVKALTKSDETLVKELVAAVSEWKFAPAVVNGKTVAAKVELPVVIRG